MPDLAYEGNRFPGVGQNIDAAIYHIVSFCDTIIDTLPQNICILIKTYRCPRQIPLTI